MDDLTPADRDDALFTLNYALRFGLTGKPHGVSQVKVANVDRLAAHLLASLERSRFVLLRLPPARGTTPGKR